MDMNSLFTGLPASSQDSLSVGQQSLAAPASPTIHEDAKGDLQGSGNNNRFFDELMKYQVPPERPMTVDVNDAMHPVLPPEMPATNGGLLADSLEINGAELARDGLAALASIDLVHASPLLTLLNGQLDSIQPDRIPSILAENNFVKNAMSTEDLQSFLNQPMPMGKLLRQFGFKTDILRTLQEQGLDFRSTVSPLEFFKLIGLDPTRVAIELDLLRNNLQAEGAAPYVARATAIQGKKTGGAKTDQLQPADPQKTEQQWRDRKTKDAKNEVMAGMAAGLPAVAAPTLQQTVGVEKNPLGSGGKSGQSAINTDGLKINGTKGGDARLQTLNDILQNQSSSNAAAQSGPVLDSANSAPSLAQHVASDPFNDLGQLMNRDASEIRRVDFNADQIPMQTTPASMDVQKELLKSQFGIDPSAYQQQGTQQAATIQQAAASSISSLGQSKPMSGAFATTNTFDGANRLSDLDSDFDPNVAQKAKPLAVKGVARGGPVLAGLDIAALTDTARDSRAGADRDEGELNGQEGQNLHGIHEKQTHKAFDANQVPEEAVTVGESRAHTMQKVIEKAQMMVKEGGGSLRLDVASPELGKIDLAVKVHNNQVELRLLSDAPRIREMLTEELPKLREALATQNLNLKNVEVGVGGGNQWSQNFAHGGWAQGGNFQEFREGNLGSLKTATERKVATQRTVIPVNGPQKLNQAGDGHIKVLV